MPFRPISAGTVSAPATGDLPAGSVATQLAQLAAGGATVVVFENFPVVDGVPTAVVGDDNVVGRFLVFVGYDTDPAGPPTSTFELTAFSGTVAPVVPVIPGTNTSGTGLWLYDIDGNWQLMVTLTGANANVTGWVALLKVADA